MSCFLTIKAKISTIHITWLPTITQGNLSNILILFLSYINIQIVIYFWPGGDIPYYISKNVRELEKK